MPLANFWCPDCCYVPVLCDIFRAWGSDLSPQGAKKPKDLRRIGELGRTKDEATTPPPTVGSNLVVWRRSALCAAVVCQLLAIACAVVKTQFGAILPRPEYSNPGNASFPPLTPFPPEPPSIPPFPFPPPLPPPVPGEMSVKQNFKTFPFGGHRTTRHYEFDRIYRTNFAKIHHKPHRFVATTILRLRAKSYKIK